MTETVRHTQTAYGELRRHRSTLHRLRFNRSWKAGEERERERERERDREREREREREKERERERRERERERE